MRSKFKEIVLERSIEGSIIFYGHETDDGLAHYAKAHMEKWIREERKSVDTMSRYTISVSYLTCPGRDQYELVACQIEVSMGSRNYSAVDMAADPKRALRRTIDHLQAIRQSHEPHSSIIAG